MNFIYELLDMLRNRRKLEYHNYAYNDLEYTAYSEDREQFKTRIQCVFGIGS